MSSHQNSGHGHHGGKKTAVHRSPYVFSVAPPPIEFSVALFPSPLYIKCHNQSCRGSINGTLFGMLLSELQLDRLASTGCRVCRIYGGLCVVFVCEGSTNDMEQQTQISMYQLEKGRAPMVPSRRCCTVWNRKRKHIRNRKISLAMRKTFHRNRSSGLQRFSLQSTGRRLRALPSHQYIALPCPLNTP